LGGEAFSQGLGFCRVLFFQFSQRFGALFIRVSRPLGQLFHLACELLFVGKQLVDEAQVALYSLIVFFP